MSFQDHAHAAMRLFPRRLSPAPLDGRRRGRSRQLALESLESRQLLSATITEYPMPSGAPAQATDIVNVNGKLWFTVLNNAIGSLDPTATPPAITTYSQGLPAGSEPRSITADQNGNVWFTELIAGQIGMLSTTNPAAGVVNYGTAQGMPANARPYGITTDARGNIWFTDQGNNALGEISGGKITEVNLPGSLIGLSPLDSVIIAGPGGKLYFTEAKLGSGTITASGIGIYNPAAPSDQAFTQVTLPSGSNQQAFGLTVGPDGNIWFSEGVLSASGNGFQSSGLGIIVNPSSSSPSLSEPPSLSAVGTVPPFRLATGPDGNIWFTMPAARQIGMVQVQSNPANDTISTFNVPTNVLASPTPSGITAGPAGSVWFADPAGAIGQVAIDAKIVISSQPPANLGPGAPFTMVVSATAAGGAINTAFSGNITLQLANNPGGSFLGGLTTVAAHNGVAVFTGLTLNNPGSSYIITASTPGLVGAPSAPFSISSPPLVQSATVLVTQRRNRRGRPIGRPVLSGYQFTFNAPMSASVANPANYQVGFYVRQRVRVRVGRRFVVRNQLALRATGFSVTMPSNNTVQILTGRQRFPMGGEIILLAAGITSAQGGLLDGNGMGQGGVNASYAVGPRGMSLRYSG